jgi:hypothetical protein
MEKTPFTGGILNWKVSGHRAAMLF